MTTMWRRYGQPASVCFCLILLWAAGGAADTIVLETGETFTTEKIWEEPDGIRFNMHGLIVKVKKQDVAALLRDDGGKAGSSRSRAESRVPAPVSQPAARASTATPQKLSARSASKKAPASSAPVESPDNTAARPSAPAASSRPLHRPAPERQRRLGHNAVDGTGISGIHWEMAPADIPGLVKKASEEDIDHYYRPDEPLRLADAALDGIVYGFWQNRLYTIMYWADGRPRYEALKNAVFDRYGTGTPGASGKERYVWRSAQSDRLLEFDDVLNSGYFWMRSRSLDRRVRQAPQP